MGEVFDHRATSPENTDLVSVGQSMASLNVKKLRKGHLGGKMNQ